MIEINFHPARKEMRVFAFLEILFFGLISYAIYRKTDSLTVPTAIFSIALSVGILGFFFPQWMRIVYVGWMIAVYPIGWLVSHLVMAVVFYLVIWPIGLTLVLMGRDPMQRKIDRQADTYWIARRKDDRTQRYFKQY